MIATAEFERKPWQSKEEIFDPKEDRILQNIASKSSEVEISEQLFNLIPCESRLRYCVDVGTRNGEYFVGNTLITHSLLVSNDTKENDNRQGHDIFVDNDHKNGRNSWFGVLLQPDDRAFQSLKQLHQPLGNLCLQISPSVEETTNNDDALEGILKQFVSDLPSDFDFLGLHEKGYSNYWILRTFLGNSTYRPKVVCISYDNKRPKNVAYIPDRRDDQELPSLKALVDLMSCYDYQLAATTSRCCFFSRKELYEGYLRTRLQAPIGKIPSVSRHPKTTDRFGGQEQKPEFDKFYPKSNHYTTSSNGTLHDNDIVSDSNFDQHNPLETMKTGMTQSKQPPGGIENRSNTMGMKWLQQRRKMSELEKTTTNSLHYEIPFKRQTPTGALPIERELGIEMKLNGTSKAKQHERLGTEIMTAWKNPKIPSDDRLESRDDFISSQTNTSGEREGVENVELVDDRETDSRLLMDNIRFNTEVASKIVSTKMKKTIPPDPIGDTIVQKIKQEQTSATEVSLEGTKLDPKNGVGVRKPEDEGIAPTSRVTQDALPKTMNGSLLELKQEILKLSQENKRSQAGAISEESIFSTNGNHDDNHDDLLPTRKSIDLTALCDPTEQNSNEERTECAKRLFAELRRNGHAMICGTTISRFLCRDALYASHLILSEADESVRSSCISENGFLRGYIPKCTEQSGSSDLKDMVRKFRLGSEKGNIPNIWPAEGLLEEETDEYIRASFQEYHDTLHRVAVLITESIQEAISFDVNNPRITEYMPSPYTARDQNSSLLTVVSCECGTRHDTKKPLVASDKDTSLLTIVLVDGGDCANIQHKLTGGEWENVRLPEVIPNDPVFIVYAGESLQKLSGGIIPSNPRRIVPCSGDQIVNGLIFSLTEPDTHMDHYLLNEEPAYPDYQKLPSSISKLTSELNSIDEVFQSYAFPENIDSLYDDEEGLDLFARELENVRKMRRNHIESVQLGGRNSSSGYHFQGSPSPIRADSWQGSAQSNHKNFSEQLLGSPQLPIVIERKNADHSSKEIVEIDKNFKPMPMPANKNVKQHSQSVGTKSFLPLASPWNPPSQEFNKHQNDFLRVDRSSVMKDTKSRGGNGKKIASNGSRVNVQQTTDDSNTSRRRNGINQSKKDPDFQQRSASQRVTNDDDYSKNSEGRKKIKNAFSKRTMALAKLMEAEKSRKWNFPETEGKSMKSSEASALLDEILGDNSFQSKSDRKMGYVRSNIESNSKHVLPSPPTQDCKYALPSPPTQDCDQIFKTCREAVSSEQSIDNTCKEVLSLQQSKKIQAQHGSAGASNQTGTLTKNNNLYNQSEGTKRPPWVTTDTYVPFRGSVVEWKMRENAKKIRNTSKIWESRGYKFGSENAKKAK